MTIDEICKLPVAEIAADNCALFLWTTNPLLNDVFKVISAWGFQYKTVAFYWTKKCKHSDNLTFGMGHYTKANCEPLLLAMKGSLNAKIVQFAKWLRQPLRNIVRNPQFSEI